MDTVEQDAGAGGRRRVLRRFDVRDLLVFLIAGIFFTWEICAWVVAHRQAAAGLPENYGNFDRVIRSIENEPPQKPFSFAVVGDPHSSSTFVRLCRRLRKEPLAFIVIVGDFSKRCRKPYHDFFQYQCAHTYGLSVPVLLVAGNRDVDYDNTYGNNISPEHFAAAYGPPNFYFERGRCLFIGLCILPSPSSSAEGLRFLETTLAARRRPDQKVFVFLHLPPMLRPGTPAGYFQNCPQFVDIVKRYEVDYVVSGHHHGCNAAQWGETTYLVTGGGGAALKEAESFGGLHHAAVFTVDSGNVSRRAVLVRRRHVPADGLARLSLVKLYPLLSKHPVDTAMLNVTILIFLSPAAARCAAMTRRRSRRVRDDRGDLVAVASRDGQEDESLP
jgi:predicted phosphodiesterase